MTKAPLLPVPLQAVPWPLVLLNVKVVFWLFTALTTPAIMLLAWVVTRLPVLEKAATLSKLAAPMALTPLKLWAPQT